MDLEDKLSIEYVEFLQRLTESKGTIKIFPPDFPHATHQALALPLAEPGMSQADTMRSVYTLAAVGVEVIGIARLMNLCQGRLLALMGGAPEAILTVEVEPEEFDFEGNLHNNT